MLFSTRGTGLVAGGPFMAHIARVWGPLIARVQSELGRTLSSPNLSEDKNHSRCRPTIRAMADGQTTGRGTSPEVLSGGQANMLGEVYQSSPRPDTDEREERGHWWTESKDDVRLGGGCCWHVARLSGGSRRLIHESWQPPAMGKWEPPNRASRSNFFKLSFWKKNLNFHFFS